MPLISFSGASPAYSNRYNASHQYNYQRKHNPPLFFEDTNGRSGAAGTTRWLRITPPLQQLESDLTNNTVARYNWITPNIHNDMHSSLKTDFAYNGVTYAAGIDEQQIALGDNFLSKIVPLIESSQAFRNNGLIVIWTDETEGSPGADSAEFTLAEIVISPLAKGNAYTKLHRVLAFLGSEDPARDFWRRRPERLSRQLSQRGAGRGAGGADLVNQLEAEGRAGCQGRIADYLTASTSPSSTNPPISRSPKQAGNCCSISSAGFTSAPQSSSQPTGDPKQKGASGEPLGLRRRRRPLRRHR